MSKDDKTAAKYPTMNAGKENAHKATLKPAKETRPDKKDESAEQWVKNRLVEAFQWQE